MLSNESSLERYSERALDAIRFGFPVTAKTYAEIAAAYAFALNPELREASNAKA